MLSMNEFAQFIGQLNATLNGQTGASVESDFLPDEEIHAQDSVYIFVNRNTVDGEDVCWYALDADKKPTQLPSNHLVGKITGFGIKHVNRGAKKQFASTKLLTYITGRTGTKYTLESGWDEGKAAICSKGIMTTLITLGEKTEEYLTWSVKPAPDQEKVVFLNIANASGNIFPEKGLSSSDQEVLLARVEALGYSVNRGTNSEAPAATQSQTKQKAPTSAPPKQAPATTPTQDEVNYDDIPF